MPPLTPTAALEFTPNPKAPAAAPAIKDPVALQKELIAVGADLGPTGADGKIGKLTKAAMANPKYAEIVKKYTTTPTQTATPATNGGSPAAAAVSQVAGQRGAGTGEENPAEHVAFARASGGPARVVEGDHA